MNKVRLIYDKEKCVGCGNCVIVCPLNLSLDVRAMGGKGGKVVVVRDGSVVVEECSLCGLCVKFCPFNALKIDANFKVFSKFEKIYEEVEEEEVDFDENAELVYEIDRDMFERVKSIERLISTGLARRFFEMDLDLIKLSGNVFETLESYIILNDLCSFCGACVASCERLEMNDRPILVDECKNCGNCLLVCPRTNLLKVKPYDEIKVYISKNFLNSILSYVLENGIFEYAIVNDGEGFKVVRDKVEVADRFSISPILNIKDGSVITCLPCQSFAFRKLQILKGYRNLILSLFCPRGSYKGKVSMGCKICTDFYGLFADISVSYPKDGSNLVITRTDLGEEILRSAVKEGYVDVEEPSDEFVEKFRSIAKKKKEVGLRNLKALKERVVMLWKG